MATITKEIGNAAFRTPGPAHTVIRALAGTGKTTLLAQIVRVLSQEKGKSVCTIAFARRDKASLEKKTKGQCKVYTSNGAGLAILGHFARQHGKALDCNDDLAYQQLEVRFRADGLIKADPEDASKTVWEVDYHTFSTILALIGKIRTCLALKANDPRFPSRPTDAAIMELADRFDMEVSTEQWPTVLFYTQWLFTELASLKNMLVWGVDCDGQVFLPVYHDLQPKTRFAVVLVDECQDQSFVNRGIAFLYLLPDGRLVAVGDENQAIYSWRGADKDSIAEMIAAMTAHANGITPETFPLTLCRRCSQAVIREAQCLVPSIQALPEAPEGVVDQLANSEELFAELVEKRKGLVLCRANAPLVSMALKLLAARVPAALLRSNIVADLCRLIDQLSKHNLSCPIADVLGKLEEWLQDRLAKLAKRKNGAAQAQVANDKAACIRALAEEATIQTAGDLRGKIDELFPNDPTGEQVKPEKMVVLSTVHGAKGGEAPDVYLYSPDGQKTCIFDQVWSDATDRDNTLYVAITRAEFRLCYAGPRPTMVRFSTPDLDLDLEGLDFGDE